MSSNLRIIGGTFKNHPLKSPSGPLTKPTMSMMRKSVFDICQSYIQDSHFLDLFACSGAMGIEALSRGASHATFVEKDKKAVQCLMENLNTFKLLEKSTVIHGDVFLSLERLEAIKPFDLIYIDPPYPLTEDPKKPVSTFIETLDKSLLLASSCLLFLEERAPGCVIPSSLHLSKLQFKNTRRFGSSLLHQFFL